MVKSKQSFSDKILIDLKIKKEEIEIEVPHIEEAYSKSANEIENELSLPSTGISEQSASSFIEKYGFNEIPKAGISKIKIYLAPIFNIFIMILLVSAVIMLILGERSSALLSFFVVIVNAITAVVQQFRAQKTLDSLQKISALKANVVRNGNQKEISSLEVIPGDKLILKQGDKIPADARVINSVDLTINEAPLTGESVAVEKNAEMIKKKDIEPIPLQKQYNMIFMGTYIETGRAEAIVTATGKNTEIGKISQNLAETGMADIPLTKKMNKLSKILTLILVSLLFIIFFYTIAWVYQTNGTITLDDLRNKFKFALSIGMNIIPIMLLLLTTIILTPGVVNLAQTGVIIRNLSAVESLGRVSIVCSDKTGTITQNQMTVQKIWYNDKVYDVTGAGYDRNGKILLKSKEVNLKDDKYLELLLLSGVINNNSSIEEEQVKVRYKDESFKLVRKALGAPTEAALVVLAEKGGIDHLTLKDTYKFIQELPFNSTVKRMSTIISNNNGDMTAFVKGASEIILDLSTKIVLNNEIKPLDAKKKQELASLIEEFAEEGYRTLSMAFKHIDNKKDKFEREEIESDLTFHGFVMILDPPREGVKEAVNSCESAGITVVMITGDHPKTAKSIATQMAIFDPGEIVVEGRDIQNLNSYDFMRTAVFARVSPSDKEIIVRRYQDQEKKQVAMTGDGINDSLALKLSNTGIAMGITGTDVAKEAADMVISDDNFASIEKGIRVGRGIFSKIRTMIYFFICMDLAEGIFFFTLAFIPNFELLNFIQHMWLVVTIHSLPPLAMTLDSHPKGIMNEPPRNDEEIFNKDVMKMLAFNILVLLVGSFLTFYLCLTPILAPNLYNLGQFSFLDPTITPVHQKAATMTTTVILISEALMIWNIRRPNSPVTTSVKNEFNHLIFIMCMLIVLAQFGLIAGGWLVIPGFRSVGIEFNQMGLNAWDWMWVIILSFQSFIWMEVYKWNARRKKVYF